MDVLFLIWKTEKILSSENYWNWNQWACRLGWTDYGGLDTLNVKMIRIESSDGNGDWGNETECTPKKTWWDCVRGNSCHWSPRSLDPSRCNPYNCPRRFNYRQLKTQQRVHEIPRINCVQSSLSSSYNSVPRTSDSVVRNTSERTTHI